MNMIYGHVINVIFPLTLHWTFFMMNTGLRNFRTKLNMVAYLIIFFLGVFFPIYYFFELLGEREQLLINERIERKRQLKKKIKNKEKERVSERKDLWRGTN